jgi:hypothetical protein
MLGWFKKLKPESRIVISASTGLMSIGPLSQLPFAIGFPTWIMFCVVLTVINIEMRE